MLEQIKNTASFIRSRIGSFTPEVGIILGTGLGGVVQHIDPVVVLEYREIPDFPVSTVKGHASRFIFGYLGGRAVVAMQGRFHYYEGYTPQQVVFPVRMMKYLGIRTLFVSNASGGVNPAFCTGTLMAITDHINLIPNPLIGPNEPELGERFPDMSAPYDPRLLTLAREVAAHEGIALQFGCYIGVTGPTFETRSEYRFYRTAGADAVGMSTTPEVIAANHMKLPVFALSVLTNMGLSPTPSSHEEVLREGAAAEERMTRLFIAMLQALPASDL